MPHLLAPHQAIADLIFPNERDASRRLLFATTFEPNAMTFECLDVFGIDVDNLSFEDALSAAKACIAGNVGRTLYFVNAHTLNLASSCPEYRQVIEQGHLIFGDGSGVRIAAAMRGVRLRSNLNGTDFIPALLASSTREKRSCYLLGAEQAVVAGAAEAISRRFPNWTVVGYHHGFLDHDTNAAVVEDIRKCRPHLLLVGMGNPIQEYWISENRDKLSVSLIVGVGALFSYLSGNYRRAPLAMRRIGFEWLWVLIMQPHKWRRYIIGNPIFLGRAFMYAAPKALHSDQVASRLTNAGRKRYGPPETP